MQMWGNIFCFLTSKSANHWPVCEDRKQTINAIYAIKHIPFQGVSRLWTKGKWRHHAIKKHTCTLEYNVIYKIQEVCGQFYFGLIDSL